MGLLQGFKNFIVGAGRFITPVGESFGATLATPEAKRLEEDILRRDLELRDSIIAQSKRAKEAGDTRKLRELNLINQRLSRNSIIDQVDAFQERPMQTFAKAGLTAANTVLLSSLGGAGLAGKSGNFLRTKPAADFIAGAGGIHKVSLGTRIAVNTSNILKQFGIGAGFGALNAISEGKTKPGEIQKEATTLGLINVILPPVLGRTLGATGKLISKSAKLVGKGLEKGIKGLEIIADEPIGKVTNQLDDFINIAQGQRFAPTFNNIVKKLAGKGAETGRFLQNIPSKLKTIVIDRLSPIRDLSKQTTEVLNRPVSFVDDPYIQARKTSGLIEGKFGIGSGFRPVQREEAEKLLKDGTINQQQFDDLISLDDLGNNFRNLLNNFKDIQQDADAYVAARNALDRIRLGNKVAKGKTKEQTKEAIALIEERSDFARFKEYTGLVKDVNNRMLDIRKNTGLINDKQVEIFQKTHPNYVPNKVLDFFDDGGASLESLTKPRGTTLSVAESGIKRAKGSEREIMNPIEAMVVDLKKALTDAERNRTANMIINQGKLLGEEFGYKQLRSAEDVVKRFEIGKTLKELGKKNREARKAISKSKVGESKLFNNIKDIGAKKETLTSRDLRLKTSQTEREMNKLFEKAKVFAAEFEPKGKINNLLFKAETRERNIFRLNREMDSILNKINTQKAEKITSKSSEIISLRNTRKEIETLLKQRVDDVKELRLEMTSLRDIKVKDVDLAKEGLGKISRMVNGVREDWVVPQDIEIAAKNLDFQEAGMITKMLSFFPSILKAGATRFNSAFVFRNPVRDIQTASIVSKTGLRGDDWIKALLQVNKKDRALYDLWRLEGGQLSGFFSKKATPKQVIKALDKAPTIGKAGDIINPFKVIEAVGDRLEQTTRLGVFKTSLRNGLSPSEAAFESRNASIDFNKMGSGIAILNRIIPFLNARIQGVVNVGAAIKRDPTVFVRRQMWSSVYPTMILNQHNNKFESYQNIDNETKNQNWIIMIGEEDGLNEAGEKIKIPNLIKLPKGEAQQIVANPIENFLDFTAGRDSKSYKELLIGLVKDTTPFAGVSSLGPITTPLELSSNFDLFREKAIVPDYINVGGKSIETEDLENKYKFTKYTSETAKKIGQFFDIAPAQVDFINGKLFGGTGRDIFKALDLTVFGKELEPGFGRAPRETLSTFEKAAQSPVIRGFLTASTYGSMVKDMELSHEVDKTMDNKEFVRRQQGEIIWQGLQRMDPVEAKTEWDRIKKEDKRTFKILNDIWDSEKQGLNSTDRIIKSKGIENGKRALYISLQLNLIDDKEGKSALWNQLINKKLLTKEVKRQLLLLKDLGKLESGE